MKNKIDDLRNHMFAQLERLGDEDLTGEELDKEIARARAMNGVAGSIIDSARVEVDFLKVTGRDKGSDFLPAPDDV
ncbi:hypothetical protein NFH98_20910 [Halomonas sp. H33-56]|uniref:hypothetical protein n=1 Tax=Halomonas sp. H33-56 TaxID=2950873 RepID=UPI0032DFE991